MNPNDDKLAVEDHRFDLLADGELDATERRALLSRLDDEPGGWRRCALAFLESQAWQEDLGSMLHKPSARPPAQAVPRRSWFGGRGTTLLAMAASFLVAMYLGSWIPRLRHSPSPVESPSVEVAGGLEELREPERQIVRTEAPPAENLERPDVFPDSVPWQMVTDSESYPLPVVRRDRLDPRWIENLPAPVPLDLVRELERDGHRVQRHRELRPYRMPDGSRLVVPVDQYDVHYVGRPAL